MSKKPPGPDDSFTRWVATLPGRSASTWETVAHPDKLFVWLAISMTLNLILFAEKTGFVSFHPENLQGVASGIERFGEGFLGIGSAIMTLVVGVRVLLKRTK